MLGCSVAGVVVGMDVVVLWEAVGSSGGPVVVAGSVVSAEHEPSC